MSAQVEYIYADTEVVDILTIDEEFRDLIPPIGKEEREQLEANIVAAGGARDCLVAWLRDDDDLVLLDGHNRYEICTRLGLPFKVAELHLDTRDEAADWIDRNQLGRRNLDARQMSLLRGRRYNRTKKPGRPTDQPGQNVRVSAESLAAEHGVNEKTIRRDGEFAEAVEALGIEREVATGKVKAAKGEVVKAAKSLPKEPTKSQIEAVVAPIRQAPAKKPAQGATKARVNNSTEHKVTLLLIELRKKVELLDKNTSAKSARRKNVANELRRLADILDKAR